MALNIDGILREIDTDNERGDDFSGLVISGSPTVSNFRQWSFNGIGGVGGVGGVNEGDEFDLHSASSGILSDGEMDMLILCDNCGVMENYGCNVKCRECDCKMEICDRCSEFVCAFCEECLGNVVVRIAFAKYSIVGKVRLVRKVYRGKGTVMGVKGFINEEKRKRKKKRERIVSFELVGERVGEEVEEVLRGRVYQFFIGK